MSSLLSAVALHKAVPLPFFLIFPLSRSPLFDLPLPLIPGTLFFLTHTHTRVLKRDYDDAHELVFLKAAKSGINGKGAKTLWV